ncbi:MAG: NADH-quinone oxidoreductase subunit N [Candidatus Cyclobacteriaceae bacterium M3_2C_046]
MINNLTSLLPLMVISGSTILVLLIIAIKRSHLLTNILTLMALTATVISLFASPIVHVQPVGILFTLDGFSTFFMAIILFASFVVVILSFNYLEFKEINKEEYYVLILLATLGAMVLVISNHFVSFFLGLEILSLSLYVLIAYLRIWQHNIEAGIKYLVLAAASSAFLLFGMALIYAETGNMNFYQLASQFTNTEIITPFALTGLALMIVGVGFKMAIVPFHFWTPDIYEGAPAPVSALIATISKGAILAVWLRFFMMLDIYRYPAIMLTFSTLAVLSMVIGNLLALWQKNVKRILAYSSIAHLGYMLVAFLAGGELGTEAVIFYLLAYFITILGAFGVVTLISSPERDGYQVEDYHGLFWRRPRIGAVFTSMLLSLAGIPLTAGFMGKFYLVAAGVSSGYWILVVSLVISSVIGLFYYLRIIVEMFKKPDELVLRHSLKPFFSLGSGITLAVLAVLLVWFGVYPGTLMEIIRVIATNSF